MLRKTASAASVPPAITPRSSCAQVEIHFVINLRNKHHKVPHAGVGTGAPAYSLFTNSCGAPVVYLELCSGTGDTKMNTNSLAFQGFMLSQRTESYPGGSAVKNLPAMQETRVLSLGQEDPLEEGMATHSSVLAWRIPWTEEPGRLQSMGLQTAGHG